MTELEHDDQIAEEISEPTARIARPWWQRILIGLGVTVVVLVVLGVAPWNFGGMGSSANDPSMRQQYRAMVAAGQTAPVKRRFVIPIPGCTCHSTDPVQTEVHRYYRMRECTSSGCHGR